MNKTQVTQVREHLKWNKSITSWEAIQEYRITRLSSIIYILRHKENLNITSTNKKNIDGKNWTEYRLASLDGKLHL